MRSVKKIAIIGAGPAGLATAANARAEGMNTIILEAGSNIGGVWGEDKTQKHGLAWPGMVVNSSRFVGTFSNFKWDGLLPDFPKKEDVYQYLYAYAKHFDLLPYIQLNSRVVKVTRKGEKWLVRWQMNETYREECFDAIAVATGKYQKMTIPNFIGLEKLSEKMLHSSQYRSANDFVNKKVLIVGGSLSGTSIAEEVSKITQVIHLIRKPRWLLKRYVSINDKQVNLRLPRDLISYSEGLKIASPEEQYDIYLKQCAKQNEISAWHMLPCSSPGVTFIENYLEEVKENHLMPIQGDIDHFTHDEVILKDGRHINFDIVIFCTGFHQDLCFLPPHLRDTTKLYDTIFPLTDKDVAFIGMYPRIYGGGAAFPIVELQARLASAVFSGRLPLPSHEVMEQGVFNANSDRHNEISFSNWLAEKLGVLPDLMTANFGLQHMLLNGAYTPARYRLNGEQSDPQKAKEMIEETECYRRQIINEHAKIPTLASLCMFKIKKMGQDKEVVEKINLQY